MTFFPLWIFAFFLWTSCGYHWVNWDQLPTLSVPFAKGDEHGLLTGELISVLAASPRFRISSEESDYRLDVEILEQKNETIGYRIDPQLIKGKTQHNMTPNEGRLSFVVQFSVTRCSDGRVVLEPRKVCGNAEYDFVDGDSYQDLTFVDASGVTQTVLNFSLGQLESFEAAQETAMRPALRNVCQKIADCLTLNKEYADQEIHSSH